MNASTESRTPALNTYTATYSPDDNNLRLYSLHRLPTDDYERLKGAGFRWAPKQGLFVAPMWTPDREDLLIELCGEIGDEDTSLAERAEERAERFETYRDKRAEDAESARAGVAAIADNIPLGQPILVGHHSEKRARKDAERIENGMRRAVKMWETSKYWTHRAAGAIRHAKYKERPDVRQRRINGLEADKRRYERAIAEAEKFVALWEREGLTKERALAIANYDHISKSFPLAEYPREAPASQYEGPMSLWSALDGNVINETQAREIALPAHHRTIAWARRWLTHLNNRLAYERAMLGDAGGTVADQTRPEKGGACMCWASPRGGWSYIQKVNRVSVTVFDNWGNGGANFTRTIPFDKLTKLMTAAEVETKRAAGLLVECQDKTGFFLRHAPGDDTKEETPNERNERLHREHLAAVEMSQAQKPEPAPFETMREQLRTGGVQVVSAPQLFVTSAALGARVIAEANIRPGHKVLEPNGGTGALVREVQRAEPAADIAVVEINGDLCEQLRRSFPSVRVRHADFLQCNSELGTFDRVVMNPPFADSQDIAHVEHASKMLRPDGRLVAIMSAGVTFRQDRRTAAFRALVEACGGTIEELPEGSFKDSGTNVRAVLVILNAA